MNSARPLTLVAVLFLAGCATPETTLDLPPDHPANPAAEEAPAIPESTTLSLDSTPAGMQHSGAEMHPHHDHGDSKPEEPAPDPPDDGRPK